MMLGLYRFTLVLHDQNSIETKHRRDVELVKRPLAGRYDEGGANTESPPSDFCDMGCLLFR